MTAGNPDMLCANITYFAHCIAISPAPLHRLPAPPDRLAEVLATIAPQLAASAAQHDLQGSFPHENFALLHASGLIAQVIPQTHGDGGAGLKTAHQIIASIAHADAAATLVLTMTCLQHRAIARADTRWSVHVRQQVFTTALNEGALTNALRVEPDLGTPARGGLPATVVTRVGNNRRTRGRKFYSTGSPALHRLSVWSRTNEAEPRVGIFLVPRPLPKTPGIRTKEIWDHLGLHASGSHDVILEDVETPFDHAVDIRPASGWAAHSAARADTGVQFDQQAWMNVLLGSLYDAVAQTARDWLIQSLNTRTPANLGGPLATLPCIQEVVGEVAATLQTNRVLLDHVVKVANTGTPPSITDSGLLKYTVTTSTIRAVGLALQVSGNHGLSRHNPLERHYRDMLCNRIHTSQNDSILLAAGRTALEVQLNAANQIQQDAQKSHIRNLSISTPVLATVSVAASSTAPAQTQPIAPLREFMTALSRLLDQQPIEAGVPSRAGALLSALVACDDWLPAEYAQPRPEYFQQFLLYVNSSERSSIVSFVWGLSQRTPIHDHTTWSLIGMLRGAEYSQPFKLDVQGKPQPDGPAVRLEPDAVEHASPRVGDIHRMHSAFDDRTSISIHVYGGNIGGIHRSVYTEDGECKPFVSGYSNTHLPNFWDRPKDTSAS